MNFPLPTVTLRHKRKGWILKINQQDWAQDLGKFHWRDYERISERHNDAGEVLVVSQDNTASSPQGGTDAPVKRIPQPRTRKTRTRKT